MSEEEVQVAENSPMRGRESMHETDMGGSGLQRSAFGASFGSILSRGDAFCDKTQSKLTQIDNSYPVDYEQTPGDGRDSFQATHQSTDNIRDTLARNQLSNKEEAASLRKDVEDAKVIWLLDRIQLLEQRLDEQDALILQLGDRLLRSSQQ